MSKFRVLVAASALFVGVAVTAQAQIVPNGGFETPSIPGYVYNPTTFSWTFVGGAGVINGNGSPFNSPTMGTAQGNQFAFLQANARRGYGGSISESIDITSDGTYWLSFLNAARQPGSQNGNTIFDVMLDNSSIGQFSTATGDDWSTKTASFNALAGIHTLSFVSDAAQQSIAGDNTMFIDNVSVTATPEPASLGLLATGLIGIAGIVVRRKRTA